MDRKTILVELAEAALGCFEHEQYHASLLLTLCAVESIARQKFPKLKHSNALVKKYINEAVFTGTTFNVAINMPEDRTGLDLSKLPRVGDDFRKCEGKPRMVKMSAVLYHAYRCRLAHESSLPDVELLPPCGSLMTKIDDKVRISADWILAILNVIIQEDSYKN